MDETYSAAYLPPDEQERRRGAPYDEPSVPQVGGWIIYAGTVLAIAGVVNVIFGIAAISGSAFYANNADYIIGSLETWGWVVLIIGILQLGAACGIWWEKGWGRVAGVAIASLSAIAQLMFLPARPLAALAVYAIDMLVVYGLLRYGAIRTADRG
jgi:hypothetical protein